MLLHELYTLSASCLSFGSKRRKSLFCAADRLICDIYCWGSFKLRQISQSMRSQKCFCMAKTAFYLINASFSFDYHSLRTIEHKLNRNKFHNQPYSSWTYWFMSSRLDDFCLRTNQKRQQRWTKNFNVPQCLQVILLCCNFLFDENPNPSFRDAHFRFPYA